VYKKINGVKYLRTELVYYKIQNQQTHVLTSIPSSNYKYLMFNLRFCKVFKAETITFTFNKFIVSLILS
jgi:hypothetical protein